MRKTSPSPAPATPDREYTIDELARGYTLASIMDLITVVDEGSDLRRALGLEPAVDAARHGGRKPLRPAVATRIACRPCIRDARDAQIRRPLRPTFDIHIDIRL